MMVSEPTDTGREAVERPYAWVIPGDDHEDMNGFIDARVSEDGEFTAPLYDGKTLHALLARAEAAEAERDTARAALMQVGIALHVAKVKARKSAMQELASLGQAQEAHEAQLRAEAERGALQAENARLRATLWSIGVGPIEGQLMEPWIKKAVAAARAALETKP